MTTMDHDDRWTKQDKGRYKKLRKRGSTVATHQSVSGFVSVHEWYEWHTLVTRRRRQCGPPLQEQPKQDDPGTATTTTTADDDVVAPHFYWRRGSCPEGRLVEGSHHRDILFSLAMPTSTITPPENKGTTQLAAGTKRSHHQASSSSSSSSMMRYKSLPSWLCLHNPVSVASVVVVEVHTTTRALHQSLVQELSTLVACNNNNHHTNKNHKNEHNRCKRSSLVVPTAWFAKGHSARCITDALLFASPERDKPKNSKKPKKQPAKMTPNTTLTDIVTKVQTLVLSPEDLVRAKHPQQPDPNDEDWIVSVAPPPPQQQQQQSHNDDNNNSSNSNTARPTQPKLFALDCEMVETTEGRALARFTLIEAIGYSPKKQQQQVTTRVALDTLVQPQHTITNYVTHISGISPHVLEQGPTMTLSQVQAYIASHIFSHDILVGHSLENDLRVCQWIHPTCVDTALVFAHSSFKYSLRHLTRVLLHRVIQSPHEPHCSRQDAQASLDLAVGRAMHGTDFGLPNTKSTNQWKALTRRSNNGNDNAAVAIGPSAWLEKYMTCQATPAHALSMETVMDSTTARAVLSFVANKQRKQKKRSPLAWTHYRVSNDSEQAACCQVLQKVVDQTAEVSDTVLLVALQCGYAHVAQEQERRRILRNPTTTLTWTDADEQALIESVETCRLGHVVWVGGGGQTKAASKTTTSSG